MSLTDIQAAHVFVNPTLSRWTSVMEACHRWIDGERRESWSVLKDIAEEGGFGYVGPNEPVRVIDYHVRQFLAYSGNSIHRHLEVIVEESIDLSLIVKRLSGGIR